MAGKVVSSPPVPADSRPEVLAGQPASAALLTGWPGLAFVLLVGGWFGAMLLFGSIVAPQIFATLGNADGGRVVAAIFPRYYALGVAASTLGALALAVAARRQGVRAAVPLACLAVSIVLLLGSWLVLEPQVAAAKGGFRGALHLLSIGLNGVVLALTAFALGWATLRRVGPG